ncbi:MAG TPA: 1,4-dihydroxy-6-naphthoate synthase [bacterium]|nr:1,4-dihydroxy-6-naphthoate synthase [bacterium]
MRFGFSPCPNDTFAFWAAVHGIVDGPPLVPEMADIEALNARAVRGVDPLPVSKLSLPALARCVDRYAVLPSGAALGFGCGPLVVARPGRSLADLPAMKLAIPGAHTTAFLLASSLLPRPAEVVAMRFDRIMAAVVGGACDAGLVIHESRFTYEQHGLVQLCDLGVLWERQTGGPLPLGVIAARRDLDAATFAGIGAMLRDSVRLARAEPERPRAWIREHAQELAEEVQAQHIELYVNDFSEELGDDGRRAVDELLRRGRGCGLLPAGRSPWHEEAP